MANVRDCNIKVSKFKLLSGYDICFRISIIGKAYLPSLELNNYTIVPLQESRYH